ncbi:hypothetical protein [Gilliamella sp. wkB308]|uniref:hypothetical protein n=1 Tax=Gilliamella sp. wkB308 TaxID=3120263 RepID=UPI0015CF4A2A|nr:hypothetical protein [Gilliamella apicola]
MQGINYHTLIVLIRFFNSSTPALTPEMFVHGIGSILMVMLRGAAMSQSWAKLSASRL